MIHREKDFSFTATEFDDFIQRHASWWEEVATGDVVYALPDRFLRGSLPNGSDSDLLRIYKVPVDYLVAERELRKVCDQLKVIGLRNELGVPFEWLEEPQEHSPFSREVLEGMKAYGWTDEHISAVIDRPKQLDTLDLRRRYRGSLGWLMTHKPFLDEVGSIRQTYADLEMPFFVQGRTAVPSDVASLFGTTEAGPAVNELVALIERWEIQGFADWHLPVPGPLSLSGIGKPGQQFDTDQIAFTVPKQFPLQNKDLGERTRELHEQRQGKRKFAPGINWQTYAKFVPLAHWDHVLETRYAGRRKPKSKTTLEMCLSETIGYADFERFKRTRSKYRKLLRGDM